MIMTIWMYFNPNHAAARSLTIIMLICLNSVRKNFNRDLPCQSILLNCSYKERVGLSPGLSDLSSKLLVK